MYIATYAVKNGDSPEEIVDDHEVIGVEDYLGHGILLAYETMRDACEYLNEDEEARFRLISVRNERS